MTFLLLPAIRRHGLEAIRKTFRQVNPKFLVETAEYLFHTHTQCTYLLFGLKQIGEDDFTELLMQFYAYHPYYNMVSLPTLEVFSRNTILAKSSFV